MALENILSGLKKATARVGLGAFLFLSGGYAGCGDDSNNCEIKETDGCEDFTGLYKITNFQEFFECTRYVEDPNDGSGVVYSGDNVSVITYEDCSNVILNHSVPPISDQYGYFKYRAFTQPCEAQSIAHGNHIHIESINDSGNETYDFTKCGNAISFRFVYVDYGIECLAQLEPVIGKDPYTFLLDWHDCE